jgi:N-methylhydantoinase A
VGYRLGVDVGGTFTDLLLFDADTGAFWRHKTPSTPHDSSEGILHSVTAICADAGVDAKSIEYFLHRTTVATDTVLEGKCAPVGLIVTEGHRDIMQITRSFVPGGLAGWITWPKPTPTPTPLAALEDTVTVGGRMNAQGREFRPLDGKRSAGGAGPAQRSVRRGDHRQLHECLYQWRPRSPCVRIGARNHARHTAIAEP